MAVSINELLDVIKRTGLPIGSNLAKVQQQQAIEDRLRGGVQEIYQPQINELDDERSQKLQQLANVDKEFTRIFGKGGKYQLENPMQTESLTAGGQNLALGNLASVDERRNNLLKEFEKDVTSATTLYGKIDPSGSGVGAADLQYLKDNYGINVPTLDYPSNSDWEIQVPDTEWELDTEGNLQPTDKINIVAPTQPMAKFPNPKEFVGQFWPNRQI